MTTKTIFITSGGGVFTIPSDFGSLVSVQAIGNGGGNGSNTSGWGAGAWAQSVSATGSNLVASGTAYYNVAAPNNGANTTWFNLTANATPTSTTQGVSAMGGGFGGATNGGPVSQCIADTAFAGGNGGAVGATYGAGGGGAAGPNGPGGNGGNGNPGAAGTGVGGGGAANNGGNGTDGNGTNGGNGGGSSGFGVGATSSVAATAATAGTGAGGGGGFSSSEPVGGAGAMLNLWTGSIYPTTTGTGTTLGPGGGGGGGAYIRLGCWRCSRRIWRRRRRRRSVIGRWRQRIDSIPIHCSFGPIIYDNWSGYYNITRYTNT